MFFHHVTETVLNHPGISVGITAHLSSSDPSHAQTCSLSVVGTMDELTVSLTQLPFYTPVDNDTMVRANDEVVGGSSVRY